MARHGAAFRSTLARQAPLTRNDSTMVVASAGLVPRFSQRAPLRHLRPSMLEVECIENMKRAREITLERRQARRTLGFGRAGLGLRPALGVAGLVLLGGCGGDGGSSGPTTTNVLPVAGIGGGTGGTGAGGAGGARAADPVVVAGSGGGMASGGAGGASKDAPPPAEGPLSWVGAWSTGPQLTEPQNMPPAPGLSGNTLRQYVFPTLSGTRTRLLLSNEFGNGPVTFASVHLASAGVDGAIDASTDRTLSFDGNPGVTIEVGQSRYSDPLDFEVTALESVA